jgi:hypothetical protein
MHVTPLVRYVDSSNNVVRDVAFALKQHSDVTLEDGAVWRLNLQRNAVPQRPDAEDWELAFTLAKGSATNAAVGIAFDFAAWSSSNYVLVPACVYKGNRFDILPQNYPPLWRDRTDFRLDMPVTMTINPALSQTAAPSRIELDTGNAATPLMGFQSPAAKTAFMVLTTQGTRFGNNGLTIEENASRTKSSFLITSPAIRRRRSAGCRFVPSDDKAADWKTGDAVVLKCRVFLFAAADVQSLYDRFAEVRKDLNSSTRVEVIPYSSCWKIMEKFYEDHRWDEEYGLFRSTDDRTGPAWKVFKLGWCGGGQVTLPLLLEGGSLSQQHALKNLDTIFSRMQTPSGWFDTLSDGHRVIPNELTLVRQEADWLFMSVRHFQAAEMNGRAVPEQWKDSIRKFADVIVRLWDKYGQFGQFVDSQSGTLLVGNSASGGRLPAALALASVYFNEPRYLEVAKASAKRYYEEYVRQGILNGGPGEILSAPDSEATFGTLESFVWLYEITGDRSWLVPARDLVRQCASWTVSYDYQFPTNSAMGRIKAHSCGAVWANVQNKHGAPGICTLSGDSLLRLARATDDPVALDLLQDIAHGIVQYVSREDHPIGKLSAGGICERVNLSDWEGRENVGGNIFDSCSWCEAAVMLTLTEIPGLYARPDIGRFVVFDNIQCQRISYKNHTLNLRLTNPTRYPAEVRVLSETAKETAKPLAFFPLRNARTIHLDPGASVEAEFK